MREQRRKKKDFVGEEVVGRYKREGMIKTRVKWQTGAGITEMLLGGCNERDREERNRQKSNSSLNLARETLIPY